MVYIFSAENLKYISPLKTESKTNPTKIETNIKNQNKPLKIKDENYQIFLEKNQPDLN